MMARALMVGTSALGGTGGAEYEPELTMGVAYSKLVRAMGGFGQGPSRSLRAVQYSPGAILRCCSGGAVTGR
jgi:hypothetical protein